MSILLSNPDSCDYVGWSSAKRWASSINFVDAAGLRPQNRAFVRLCHSPAFDRNYAGKERTKFSFGFLQDRRTHHIDPQSLGKFDGGGPSKTFQRARDGCSRGAGEDRFVVENARNQSEGSPFFDERDRLLNQIDLTHELASQRKLPLFSGEFRKRSKCDFACCNGHGIKRADGLIKLPDAFAVLDLDLKTACFASALDYLMATTRQCRLNQFADRSVCSNQNNFHRNSFLPALDLCHTAIDCQLDAGDVTAFVRGQEEHGRSNFLWGSSAAHRYVQH